MQVQWQSTVNISSLRNGWLRPLPLLKSKGRTSTFLPGARLGGNIDVEGIAGHLCMIALRLNRMAEGTFGEIIRAAECLIQQNSPEYPDQQYIR